VEEFAEESGSLLQTAEREQQRLFRVGPGGDPEGNLADDPDGPHRADHQFGHVVAGDILHRFSTRYDNVSVGENRLHPEDEVPAGPVEKAL